jgi:hypothetical protein
MSRLTTAASAGMNLEFLEDFAHDESTNTAISSRYIRLSFLCFIIKIIFGLKHAIFANHATKISKKSGLKGEYGVKGS